MREIGQIRLDLGHFEYLAHYPDTIGCPLKNPTKIAYFRYRHWYFTQGYFARYSCSVQDYSFLGSPSISGHPVLLFFTIFCFRTVSNRPQQKYHAVQKYSS